MIIIGLTGSIGMGKSTASRLFRNMGVPVHDSDEAVHLLLQPGGQAVSRVLAHFHDMGDGQGGIDRKKLGNHVFYRPREREALEEILHPLVRASQERFLKRHRLNQYPVAVLDIPLLFETGAEKRVDYTVVVTAPAFIQRQRVLARGMDEAAFQARLTLQTPEIEKKRRADFIVQTGHGLAYTRSELKTIVATVLGRRKPR